MKRARTDVRLHISFELALRKLNKEASKTMAGNLESRFPLGIATKSSTCPQQAADAKLDFPNCIIFLRVGDFYECFGIDSVIVAEFTNYTSSKNDVKQPICIRHEKIQDVLNILLSNGWCSAMYEESRVLVTPRQRFFCQLITHANPAYIHSKTSGNDIHDAKPIVAISSSESNTWDVALCNLQQRSIRMYTQIDESTASALTETTGDAIICIRNIPNFVKNNIQEKVLLGGVAECNIVDRMVNYLAQKYKIGENEFKICPAREFHCAPCTRFTLVQLGIDDRYNNTPSLVDSALTLKASSIVRNQFLRWLSHPPAHHKTIKRCILSLLSRSTEIPELRPTRFGKWRNALQNNALEDLATIHKNLSTLYQILYDKDDTIGKQLITGISSDINILFEKLNFKDMLAEFDSRMVDGDIRDDLITTEEIKLFNAKKSWKVLTATLPDGSYGCEKYNNSHITWLHGRPDGVLKLPVHDRNGRIIVHKHTTIETKGIDAGIEQAMYELEEKKSVIALKLTNALVSYQAELEVLEHWAVELATIVDHTRAVGNIWHVPYESNDGSFICRSLFPYWMPNGKRNSIDIQAGTPIVLTGPNTGGKSTLMRTVGAIGLLAQCGLMVPCENARVPIYNNIFIRAGAGDCTNERRSSFASEMADVKTMISASGDSLILIDEPCKGTSTSDGVKLLEAILQWIPQRSSCMITTHYHELEAKNCEWLQLTSHIDEFTCDHNPNYELVPGKCQESLALRVALAAGLPVELVQTARDDHDIDTLLISIFYKLGLKYIRMKNSTSLPPPSLKSAVYALVDEDNGVYLGETDRIENRLKTHHRTKKIKTIFMISVENKSIAMQMETQILRELSYHNVVLLTFSDAAHEVR